MGYRQPDDLHFLVPVLPCWRGQVSQCSRHPASLTSMYRSSPPSDALPSSSVPVPMRPLPRDHTAIGINVRDTPRLTYCGLDILPSYPGPFSPRALSIRAYGRRPDHWMPAEACPRGGGDGHDNNQQVFLAQAEIPKPEGPWHATLGKSGAAREPGSAEPIRARR